MVAAQQACPELAWGVCTPQGITKQNQTSEGWTLQGTGTKNSYTFIVFTALPVCRCALSALRLAVPKSKCRCSMPSN